MENRVLNPTLVSNWKQYFKDFHWNFAGTMFRGPRQELLWFHQEFEKTLKEILDAGYAPLEQEVANYRWARMDAWLLHIYAKEAIKFRQWTKLHRLGRCVLETMQAGYFEGSMQEFIDIMDLWYDYANSVYKTQIRDYCRKLALAKPQFANAVKNRPRLIY
jgi:hypothetical protein